MADRDRHGAMMDQLLAAAADGAHFMDIFHRDNGGDIVFVPPAGYTKRFEDQFLAGRLAGTVGDCPHLGPEKGPAPMFWSPYLPDLIRCMACVESAQSALGGTPEDLTCDGCRKQVTEGFMHSCAVQIPAAVLESRQSVAYLGPLTITYGLCPVCMVLQERYQTEANDKAAKRAKGMRGFGRG